MDGQAVEAVQRGGTSLVVDHVVIPLENAFLREGWGLGSFDVFGTLPELAEWTRAWQHIPGQFQVRAAVTTAAVPFPDGRDDFLVIMAHREIDLVTSALDYMMWYARQYYGPGNSFEPSVDHPPQAVGTITYQYPGGWSKRYATNRDAGLTPMSAVTLEVHQGSREKKAFWLGYGRHSVQPNTYTDPEDGSVVAMSPEIPIPSTINFLGTMPGIPTTDGQERPGLVVWNYLPSLPPVTNLKLILLFRSGMIATARWENMFLLDPPFTRREPKMTDLVAWTYFPYADKDKFAPPKPTDIATVVPDEETEGFEI